MTDLTTNEFPEHQPVLSQDKVFHILQAERRRHTVLYLEYVNTPVSRRKVTDQVTAWENNVSKEEITSKQRQKVYVALYQNHLPVLDENDVIEYDSDRGDIEIGETHSQITYYLNGPFVELPTIDEDASKPPCLVVDAEEHSLPKSCSGKSTKQLFSQ